jgi:hypothetical protein
MSTQVWIPEDGDEVELADGTKAAIVFSHPDTAYDHETDRWQLSVTLPDKSERMVWASANRYGVWTEEQSE